MTKVWFYVPFLATLIVASEVRAQDTAIVMPEGAEIPYGVKEIPRYFETYTLFLVPDEEWVSKEKSTDLARLYQDFHRFGDVIGEHNLAVWFGEAETEVDVFRNRKYCDKFALPYRGPYIITSSKHPDSELAPNDYYTLNLNGISSERISNILDILADSIVSNVFVWEDALNTSPISFFRFRYPAKAATSEPIKDAKTNLRQIFSMMNNLPLKEKKLNTQILIVLLVTLLASTLFTVKARRIRLRQQRIGASAAIFFIGVVCYYIIYKTIFFTYIGDTIVVLMLTIIYGLIPQRITKQIPVVKRIITHREP